MFFTYRGKGRQRCRPSLACNGEEPDAAQGIHVVSVSVLGSANAFIQNCGSRKTARILKHYIALAFSPTEVNTTMEGKRAQTQRGRSDGTPVMPGTQHGFPGCRAKD